AIALLAVREGRGAALVAVPLVSGLCDEIENVCQLTLVRGLPDFSPALFYTGALAAITKWVLVLGSVGIIAWLGLSRRSARGA
ncbi:MAG: hypothetical protein KC466_13725, partial [Myxococcales bacterium]|nr:hypothetical protein [Myxococcales bacterium]